MVPVLAGVDHRSVAVEPANSGGAEYCELLSAQTDCGALASVRIAKVPKLVVESAGAVGVPPPTSE